MYARRRVGCWVALLMLLGSAWLPASRAGDWPQILGPQRNGVARDEEAVAPWPASGPRRRWTYALGQGYAGPAVVGERVIVFHRDGTAERLEAVHAETGQPLWRADFAASYRGGVNPDLGPRCVPVVHGDHVFAFGAAGDLHCVSLNTGQKVWTREAYADFAGREGYFGAGSTPIVADDKLLVNVGGRNAGLVAFDLNTGETVWQATDEGASYSSPAAARVGSDEHVVFVTRLNAVSVDPRDGAVRFRFPFGQTGPTVNAATPLIFEDRLFVSASYGIGGQLWNLAGASPQSLWSNDSSMSSQYATCVYHDGHLYGSHGREDLQTGELRCIEATTGKVRWSRAEVGVAHVILVRDRLLVVGIDGQLRLVAAVADKYEELAATRLVSPTAGEQTLFRALPALSNGKLYLRDNGPSSNTGALACWDLRR